MIRTALTCLILSAGAAAQAQSGAVTISSEIKSKTPKRPRARSFYWITENGELSTEHPNQTDMFKGPRDTAARTAEPAV